MELLEYVEFKFCWGLEDKYVVVVVFVIGLNVVVIGNEGKVRVDYFYWVGCNIDYWVVVVEVEFVVVIIKFDIVVGFVVVLFYKEVVVKFNFIVVIVD